MVAFNVVNTLIQVLQIIAAVIATYLACWGRYYKMLGQQTADLKSHEAMLRSSEAELRTLEAMQEEVNREHELALERWGDSVAASVGEELETVVDMVYTAMELNDSGQDVAQALSDIHGELCCTIGHLESLRDAEG